MDKKYIKGKITGFNNENKTINIDGVDFHIEEDLEFLKPSFNVLYYQSENGENVIEDIIPYDDNQLNTDIEFGEEFPKSSVIYHSAVSYFISGIYFLFIKNIGCILTFFGLLFVLMLSIDGDSELILFINSLINFFIEDLFDLSYELTGGGFILFLIFTIALTILDLFPFTFKYFSNKEVTEFKKDVGFLRSLTLNFKRLNYIIIKVN